MNLLTVAGSVAALLGTVGGGALYVERRVASIEEQSRVEFVDQQRFFDHAHDFETYVAQDKRGFILDQVEKARGIEPGEYKTSVCKTIRQAIAELCAAAKDDAICVDRELHLKRAGCE